MVRHGIKGIIGGGAATMAEGPIHAYREAAARAGRNLALGEDLCLGIFFKGGGRFSVDHAIGKEL